MKQQTKNIKTGPFSQKQENLTSLLRSMSSIVVAYSGGVDSTFLAAVAHQVLGDKAQAVTAASPTYQQRELESATELVLACFSTRNVALGRP